MKSKIPQNPKKRRLSVSFGVTIGKNRIFRKIKVLGQKQFGGKFTF